MRIDTATRESKIPDISSNDEARAYLKSVQVGIYEEEYKKRVTLKIKEENRILTDTAVDELTDIGTTEEFVTQLNKSVIANRDHVGFEALLKRVVGPCFGLRQKEGAEHQWSQYPQGFSAYSAFFSKHYRSPAQYIFLSRLRPPVVPTQSSSPRMNRVVTWLLPSSPSSA
jgi:hypothetical protein